MVCFRIKNIKDFMQKFLMDANGLHDDNHYTSAYDMALIGRAFALSVPESGKEREAVAPHAGGVD